MLTLLRYCIFLSRRTNQLINKHMKKSHYKDNPLIGNYPKTKSQEENYTTEALASLLSYMVNNDRKFASRFLGLLTSSKFNLRNYNSTDVKIRTQVRTSKGTPDIE